MNDGYIAVIDAGYSSYDFEKHVFEQHGYRFDVFPGESQDVAGKLQFAKEAVGLLVRWTSVNEAFLSCLPHVKAMVRYGVGYDNVDLLPLLEHPRVIATGHYAWYSTRSSVELQKRAALNLLGLLSGKPVDDELTSLLSR